jgi:hypothetical protein
VFHDSSKYFPFTWLPSDIRNWIRNIEQHASDNVNKILVGNKADMEESKRAVPTAKGQALADEFGIKFFETVSDSSTMLSHSYLAWIIPGKFSQKYSCMFPSNWKW